MISLSEMSNDHEISEVVEIPIELAHTGSGSAPLPADTQTSTQLEVELSSGKTRSKMRMLAILIALYVCRYYYNTTLLCTKSC